ncbi:hypothetical protein Tco_0464824 [Tanacetum coccineum]
MVPRTVLTRSGPILLNTTRPVNIVQPRTAVNNAGPLKNVINNAYSTSRRPFNKITVANNNNFTKKVNTVKGTRVNTARPKVVLSVVKGNKGNAIKASTYLTILMHKQDLKDKGVIDSGCSRHITGNRSYLTDYEEIDGGFVAFGGNSKGGKMIGKGTIRTGKLDFEDVYFVKKLKFNLFSVSQMCDKKNDVLFTDTEYVVRTNEPKTARKEDGAPIIKDWVSESEEEDVPKIKTVEMFNKPSFAKTNFVKSTKQVKSPRNTSVDKNRQNSPSPKGNKRN